MLKHLLKQHPCQLEWSPQDKDSFQVVDFLLHVSSVYTGACEWLYVIAIYVIVEVFAESSQVKQAFLTLALRCAAIPPSRQ